jgi:hypothetical protein
MAVSLFYIDPKVIALVAQVFLAAGYSLSLVAFLMGSSH